MHIEIKLPVEISNDDEDDRCEKIREWLNTKIDDLFPALDLSLPPGVHPGTYVIDDSVYISMVEINGDEIIITYQYDYDGYSSCKDQDCSGEDEGVLYGTLINNTLKFVRQTTKEKRSTFDEF